MAGDLLTGAANDDLMDIASGAKLIENLDSLASGVAALGLFIAFIGLLGTVAAARMHFLWTTEINKIAKAQGTPPFLTFGMEPYWPARSTAIMPVFVALAFIFAWIAFVELYLATNIQMFIYGGLTVVALIIIAFIKGFTDWGRVRQGQLPEPIDEPAEVFTEPARMAKLKAVFFDVDGVLLDTFR